MRPRVPRRTVHVHACPSWAGSSTSLERTNERKTDCQSVPRFLRHDCPDHSACPRVPVIDCKRMAHLLSSDRSLRRHAYSRVSVAHDPESTVFTRLDRRISEALPIGPFTHIPCESSGQVQWLTNAPTGTPNLATKSRPVSHSAAIASAVIPSRQSLRDQLGGERQAKILLSKRDVIAVSYASLTVHVGVIKVTARRQLAASRRPHHRTVPAL